MASIILGAADLSAYTTPGAAGYVDYSSFGLGKIGTISAEPLGGFAALSVSAYPNPSSGPPTAGIAFIGNAVSALADATNIRVAKVDYPLNAAPLFDGSFTSIETAVWPITTGNSYPLEIIFGAGSAPTLDPSDMSANMLLNGDLRAYHQLGTYTFGAVRTTVGKSSGKWYFEAVANPPSLGNVAPAVASASASLTAYLGGTTESCSYFNSGFVGYNGNQAYYASFAIGDIIGVAFDADAKKVWFSKNGVWQSGNPATGTGGISTPGIKAFFPAICAQYSGDDMTLNLGASPFQTPPPTGFSAFFSGVAEVYEGPHFGSVATGAGSTVNLTPTMPSYTVGDRLFLEVETANQAVATPAGWTLVGTAQGTGTAGGTAATRLTVFTRVPTSAGEAAPILIDPGDHCVAHIFSTGPSDIHAVVGSVLTAASTTAVMPDLTTTVPNCLILALVTSAADTDTARTSAWTNGFAMKGDFSSSQGNGGGVAVASKEQKSAGAVGATQCTMNASTTQGKMMIALAPPTSTPGPTRQHPRTHTWL